MADFLTRLAGRVLGVVPTVQPILAPMYAPVQQFVGAEDAQEMPLFERGAATGYPQAEVRGRAMSLQNRPADEPAFGGLVGQIMEAREMSLQDRPPYQPPFGDLVGQTVHARATSLQNRPADEPAFGDLVGQIMEAREISSPPVPQGSQLSTTPAQTPHISSRTLDGQPAADHPLSSGRDDVASSAGKARGTESTRNASVSGLHPIHPTDHTVIPLEPRTASRAAEQQRDSSLLPRTAREILEAEELSSVSTLLLPLVPQGPVAASLASPVADTLPTQWPAAPKIIPLQQSTRQVGYAIPPYNRVNEHEAALTTQEPSTAPTIQVTIGRIEVRATPAATPRPQAARSAPSVMSLDDYLNQRVKGGH